MKTNPYCTPEAYQNWKAACLYYFPECKDQLKPNRKGWVLHHKDQSLRHTDINRYNEWRIEDVIPMTNEDHIRLHSKGNHYKLGHKASDETRAKMSASMKGRKAWNKGISPSDDTRAKMSEACKGRKHSDETRAKMGAAHKGNTGSIGFKWWNNGITSVFCKECPEGYVAGRLYKRKGS